MWGDAPAEALKPHMQPRRFEQQTEQRVSVAPGGTVRTEQRVEERRGGFLGLRVAQTTVINTHISRQCIDRGRSLERVHERVCRWVGGWVGPLTPLYRHMFT